MRVNLHAALLNSQYSLRHLYFRDALRGSAQLAKRYAELKAQLAARFPSDRVAYTAAKAPFIDSVLREFEA